MHTKTLDDIRSQFNIVNVDCNVIENNKRFFNNGIKCSCDVVPFEISKAKSHVEGCPLALSMDATKPGLTKLSCLGISVVISNAMLKKDESEMLLVKALVRLMEDAARMAFSGNMECHMNMANEAYELVLQLPEEFAPSDLRGYFNAFLSKNKLQIPSNTKYWAF